MKSVGNTISEEGHLCDTCVWYDVCHVSLCEGLHGACDQHVVSVEGIDDHGVILYLRGISVVCGVVHVYGSLGGVYDPCVLWYLWGDIYVVCVISVCGDVCEGVYMW